jgi:hypothetical protein
MRIWSTNVNRPILKKRRRRKPVQNVLIMVMMVVAEVPVMATAAQQVEVAMVAVDLNPLLEEILSGLLPKKERMASSLFGPRTWENNLTSGILKQTVGT